MMSFFFAVPNPPFQRIDTAGPLICEVRPYLDSFGNFDAFLYIFKQSSYNFCQTFIVFNSLAFLSACSMADHSNPCILDPLNPL